MSNNQDPNHPINFMMDNTDSRERRNKARSLIFTTRHPTHLLDAFWWEPTAEGWNYWYDRRKNPESLSDDELLRIKQIITLHMLDIPA